MSALAAPSPGGAANAKTRTLRFRAWLVAGGLAFGALAGYLASSGSIGRVFALTVVFLPVVLWKRLYLAPAILLTTAVLVEQEATVPSIPITDKIPLFQAVGPGHLQGADILLLVMFLIYMMKPAEWGTRWMPRTHLSLAVRAVLACIVVAIVVGQRHHGALRVALMQSRPYVYVAVTYFLTSSLVRDRRAIHAALWGFVVSVGFKALQGTYVWIHGRHMFPKPESYITHEASYFFVIFMVLVLALWLFDQRGRLRTWATWLLPLVIWANVVNERRVAWEMLGGALLCFGVIAYQAMPFRRRLLGKACVGLVLFSAVYFPVMWNSTSSLGMAARAIKSQVSPSQRDAASDIYRIQENDNLELNIKRSAPLGEGLGVKIDYALPITDISLTDSMIAYLPHDGVLDLLVAMGLLGAVAMWSLIGVGIVSGCRLAYAKDRELALIGALVACTLVAYALMGAVDQGFVFYRIAFITGTLLGFSEAARRMWRAQLAPPPALVRERRWVAAARKLRSRRLPLSRWLPLPVPRKLLPAGGDQSAPDSLGKRRPVVAFIARTALGVSEAARRLARPQLLLASVVRTIQVGLVSLLRLIQLGLVTLGKVARGTMIGVVSLPGRAIATVRGVIRVGLVALVKVARATVVRVIALPGRAIATVGGLIRVGLMALVKVPRAIVVGVTTLCGRVIATVGGLIRTVGGLIWVGLVALATVARAIVVGVTTLCGRVIATVGGLIRVGLMALVKVPRAIVVGVTTLCGRVIATVGGLIRTVGGLIWVGLVALATVARAIVVGVTTLCGRVIATVVRLIWAGLVALVKVSRGAVVRVTTLCRRAIAAVVRLMRVAREALSKVTRRGGRG